MLAACDAAALGPPGRGTLRAGLDEARDVRDRLRVDGHGVGGPRGTSGPIARETQKRIH